MTDIKILAIPNEQSPKSIMELVEEATKLHKDSPLIIALPESVFGDYALTRQQSKSMMIHIHNALAKHGNAFVFTSVVERIPSGKGKQSISNSGYIVTPNERKRWIVYPKTSFYTHKFPHRPTMLDSRIIYNNSGNSLSKTEESIELWTKRSRKIRDYPQIEINGKKIQLRICADVSMHESGKFVTRGDSKNKVDLIIVPAETYPARDFSIDSLPLKQNGRVLIVDKTEGLAMADSTHKFPARLGKKVMIFDGFALHARPKLKPKKDLEKTKTPKKPIKTKKRGIFRRKH